MDLLTGIVMLGYIVIILFITYVFTKQGRKPNSK